MYTHYRINHTYTETAPDGSRRTEVRRGNRWIPASKVGVEVRRHADRIIAGRGDVVAVEETETAVAISRGNAERMVITVAAEAVPQAEVDALNAWLLA